MDSQFLVWNLESKLWIVTLSFRRLQSIRRYWFKCWFHRELHHRERETHKQKKQNVSIGDHITLYVPIPQSISEEGCWSKNRSSITEPRDILNDVIPPLNIYKSATALLIGKFGFNFFLNSKLGLLLYHLLYK